MARSHSVFKVEKDFFGRCHTIASSLGILISNKLLRAKKSLSSFIKFHEDDVGLFCYYLKLNVKFNIC